MKIKINETFSYKVKLEVASGITGRKKSDACLLALVLFSQTDNLGCMTFRTDSDTLRDLLIRLLNHACENENAASESINRSRGRAPEYVIKLSSQEDAIALKKRLFLKDFNSKSVYTAADSISEKHFGAFLAGMFLASGRITSPDKEYHLEFVLKDDRMCAYMLKILSEKMGIIAGVTSRRSQSIVYLKDSEGIEDVLTFIGAPMSSLEIMNVKVYKDIRNRANRATNCDTANCDRQNRTAIRQIEAITVIENSIGLGGLSDELKAAAELRLKYPEYNLDELSKEFSPPLSKSGVNHRLSKIEAIAKEIIANKETHNR